MSELGEIVRQGARQFTDGLKALGGGDLNGAKDVAGVLGTLAVAVLVTSPVWIFVWLVATR